MIVNRAGICGPLRDFTREWNRGRKIENSKGCQNVMQEPRDEIIRVSWLMYKNGQKVEGLTQSSQRSTELAFWSVCCA